jgi:hypothetical protein
MSDYRQLSDTEVANAAQRAGELAEDRCAARVPYVGEARALTDRYHDIVSVAVGRAAPVLTSGGAYGALLALVSHATEHMNSRPRAGLASPFSGQQTAEFHLEHFPDAAHVHAERVNDVLRIIAATGIKFADDGRAVRELTAYVDTVRQHDRVNERGDQS